MTKTHPVRSMSESFRPVPAQIDQLIERASGHPLGINFLKEGDLCSVAIIFGVTVFEVEAARTRLQNIQKEN